MQRFLRGTVALLLLGLLAGPAQARPLHALDLGLVRIDGAALAPDSFAGRVVLFVNVASLCAYTPQYAELQALHARYADRGLVVVGVPCNQFGGQEPGSGAEIKAFCESRYGVTFPLLAKQEVNGPARSPLYRWLVASGPGEGRDVAWNFEKFLVGRDGEVVARFASAVDPQDATLRAAIELALSATPPT
ncbi:MAG: glutathione peroxidase [Alphaproteobacteria bacterium]|nr:glutathione peroxidase [Alphaproteobacteria bacterium]